MSAVLSATALAQSTPAKRIYIGNDDHTDYFWSADGNTYKQVFQDKIDYYLGLADSTAGNASPYQNRFNCDGSFWLWTYQQNRSATDFARVMARVKDGHLSAPMTGLVSCYGGQPAEAVLRGMYYPGHLERAFNTRFTLAVAMENQTIPLGLPSLWAGAGAKYSWRGVCGCASKLGNATLRQRDHEIYYYTGADGQKVLMKWHSLAPNAPASGVDANELPGGYAEAFDPVASINYLDTDAGFNSRYVDPVTGLTYAVSAAFGFGWDAIDRRTGVQNQTNPYPPPTYFPYCDNFDVVAQGMTTPNRQVIVSNEHDFFEDFEARYGTHLPAESVTYGNEWELSCASMAETSARVKRAVEKLRSAEAMATLVSLQTPGFMTAARTTARDLAFMDLGLYWEHDFVGGGPIGNDPRMAWQNQLASDIEAYVNPLASDAATALGGLISNGGSANARYFVFNPLSWARTDFADLPTPDITAARYVVNVATGAQVPSQYVTAPDGTKNLRILASGVPAVGYAVYEVRAGTGGTTFPPAATVGGAASSRTLDNKVVKVTLDNDGSLSSFVDHTQGDQEFVKAVGGQTVNDLSGQPVSSATVTTENAGPVSVTLKVVNTVGLPHTARVTLYAADSRRVDIRNDITANFTDVRTWDFGFNLAAPDTHTEEVGAILHARLQSDGGDYALRNARYDWLSLNHFGDVTGTVGTAKRGVTLSNADCYFAQLGGSTVSSLDTGTAQLRVLAGGQVDAGLGMPNQNGATQFMQRFALLPHADYDPVAAMKFALEHQNPFSVGAVSGTASSPYPAATYAFLSIDNPNVLLWALKPHDDGIANGVVARVWNLGAAAQTYKIGSAQYIGSAKHITHIETDDATLTAPGVADGIMTATTAAFQMQTHRLLVGPAPVVSVTAPAATAELGNATGTFALSRTGDLGGSLTVQFTLGGTAVNGTDYTRLANPVSFAAGVVSSLLNVSPTAGSVGKGNQTVTLGLAAGVYTVGSPAAATVTILDSPIDAWRVQKFGNAATNPVVAGDLADPNGNGLPNLIEYAIGIDPQAAGISGQPTVGQDGGHLTLTYTHVKSANDLVYTVEVTGDLTQPWQSGAAYTEQTGVVDHNATEAITVRDRAPQAGNARRFIHLRVSRAGTGG